MFSEHQLKSIEACGEVIKQSRRMSMTPPVDDDFPEVKHDFDNAVLTYAALLRPTPAPVKVAEMYHSTPTEQRVLHKALMASVEFVDAAPAPVPAAEREEAGELWSWLRSVLEQGQCIGLDYANKPYEEFSARIDLAARERCDELLLRLAARALRGTVTDEMVTPIARAMAGEYAKCYAATHDEPLTKGGFNAVVAGCRPAARAALQAALKEGG